MPVEIPLIGQTVSHYKILERLGGGGMGVVYRAQDLKLDRSVALKFLPPDLTRDLTARQRFIHEARAASALDHQNICNIHDIGETDDRQTFIVMAYYEGATLTRKIEREPLNIEEAIDIAIQVARGLAKAHENGIVHRDIKPANIIITADGVAKIVDFGLAKLSRGTMLTKTGSTVGTAAYMSPEQARGGKIDARTDIWSLGVVLYEMLTGKRPYESDYEQALVYSIMNETPRPIRELRADVPEALTKICLRAMTRSAEQRYQSAAELLADLEAYREGSTLSRQTRRVVPGRRRFVYAAAALVGVMAVLAILIFFPSGDVIDSIAVLPFDNLSGDTGQDYFYDGMTTAIIDELTKIKSLRSISWQSVKRYKKSDKSIPEIARELDVQAIVSPRVVREKEHVRISASLVLASPERTLWQDSFVRTISEILDLQAEVVRAIIHQTKVAVTSQEQERLTTHRTVNADAYDAYLKGRFIWAKRTDAERQRGTEYFHEAIRLDSSFALAYSGLADCYMWPFEGMTFRESSAMAKGAAMRALELDSTLAEAHTSLAWVLERYEWSWKEAEAHYQRAIEFNPNYARAHTWYGLFLVLHGRADEGIAAIRHALTLDPLSLQIHADLGLAYFWTRRFRDGISHMLKTLELDSSYALTYRYLSHNYMALGIHDSAVGATLRMFEIEKRGSEDVAALRRSFDLRGWQGYLREYLRQLLRRGDRPNYIANTYMRLGIRDSAFLWLNKAVEQKDAGLAELGCQFDWDSVRTDPRFVDIMKRVGMTR